MQPLWVNGSTDIAKTLHHRQHINDAVSTGTYHFSMDTAIFLWLWKPVICTVLLQRCHLDLISLDMNS